MEPNTSPTSRATRLSFFPLGLFVGVFVLAYAPQTHAQDAVAPDTCATDATVHDDGDDANGSDEDSVAVGCGAKVEQGNTTTATGSHRQHLYSLDAGRDGTVDGYYVKVDCTDSDVGVCADRTGAQLVGISKALHDRLKTVGDDVAETTGSDGTKVRTAGPLTDSELAALSTALMSSNDVRSERVTTAVATNRLTASGSTIMRAGDSATEEVADATVVGADATVKADGGVAIGNGANVGGDKTTRVTLTMDPDLGVLVVGYEETATGAGGENAIAIGNGASATGDGAIAIGNGAKATEDGQVMIGSHDIGAMANDVASNTGKVAANTTKIDANTTKIDANTGKINTNTGKINTNANRINENRGMINSNKGKIDRNAGRINENRGMINTNAGKISMHDNMIDNAMTRLGNHDTVLKSHDARLVAHGATLAEHNMRLNTHDQVLMGHAAGITNNAMQIQMLDDRVSQAAAAAAALSAVPNSPGKEEQFFMGVGVGSHGGESSVAAGISGRLGANRNIVVNAGIANSGDGTSLRAGVGWSF